MKKALEQTRAGSAGARLTRRRRNTEMAAPPDATASTKRARGRPHSKGNTVVGGFAPATKLKLLEKDIHGAGLTLLSAKRGPAVQHTRCC